LNKVGCGGVEPGRVPKAAEPGGRTELWRGKAILVPTDNVWPDSSGECRSFQKRRVRELEAAGAYGEFIGGENQAPQTEGGSRSNRGDVKESGKFTAPGVLGNAQVLVHARRRGEGCSLNQRPTGGGKGSIRFRASLN